MAISIRKKGKTTRKKIAPRKKPKSSRQNFGALSTVQTAPVAIGNSIRGSDLVVRRNGNKAICAGRDFMFTPVGSGSITTWTMVGGTPISPVAFVDSKIRQFLQMYQKYRWKRLVVHYITSSPTSSTGDVMFYYGKNRDSVFLNQTSNLLLQFVMSDSNTVIGPQWTNHSAELSVQGTWKSTDYGMSDDPNEYSDGEVFLMSKTSTTDSPGYVLFDYEIEFAEEQISPRLLTLPYGRAQYNQINLGGIGLAVTNNVTKFIFSPVGVNISGSASVVPPGASAGDIYKVIFDVTNSSPASWTVATVNNLLGVQLGGTSTFQPVPISDGFTAYCVFDGAGFRSVGTCQAAYSGIPDIAFGVTGTVTFNIQCWLSLIGTISKDSFMPNY